MSLAWSSDPELEQWATEIIDRMYAVGALTTGVVLSDDQTYVVVWPGEAVSSGGRVATIRRASTNPVVDYHQVALNGAQFEAAWAGEGRIALWGKNGLGTIDIRTWKTHAIAAGVTDAVATPYGIAAWTSSDDGLTLYRPDGSRKFHTLTGTPISAARALGRWLYVDTPHKRRYTIDLRTGTTSPPLPATATILLPSYTPIP